MKNTELFYLIFKQTHMDKFLLSFAVCFTISCTLLWIIDPSLHTIGDAFWFGFTVITTIGFGDYTVTSLAGRLLTCFLGVYGICLFGFVCGVGASYLFEKTKMGKDESVSEMIWQLEHLDQLDSNSLKKLSATVRDRRQKQQNSASSPRRNSSVH